MNPRRLVCGRLGWPYLETVACKLARQYDRDSLHIRLLEADNWLLIPMVVDDEWFVKVISKQNSLIHTIFITGRNFSASFSETEGLFGHFRTPSEMAEYEFEAMKRLRGTDLQAPAPAEAFEVDGLGVFVLEYLPGSHTLDTAPQAEIERSAPELPVVFVAMHGNRLAYGDLRAENALVRGDGIYFIDAMNANNEGMRNACAYDLACGLAALEPLVGPKETVTAASDFHDADALLDAVDLLDFVSIWPDHDFDATSLKGEVEKHMA